jgi:hypothetical protein
METAIYRNLRLLLVCNVNALLDNKTLRRVIPQGTDIPAALKTATNCCWVNVWIATLAAMGVRLSATDADDLMRRITAAGSRMMSPLDTGDLVTRVNLPATLVEYSFREQVGWSIGTPNGPIIAFVNTGAHYQIWLPVGSDLAQRFAAPVTPARSDTARRHAETKGKVKATAGARKVKATAGACVVKATAGARKVKAVSKTRPLPAPVRKPGASPWWGRGGEPAVTNPTPTKTVAQAASAERSLALQIAAEDRAIADSIEDETRRLEKISLDLIHTIAAEDLAIEDETRRLAKLSLDLANQMDDDASMARELSDQLNGR